MRDVRLCSLQWAVGTLCAATGALIFVAPHQFDAPVYASIQTHLRLWGLLFLTAGVTMLGVVAMTPRRTVALVAHLVSGVALLGMAMALLVAGAWIGGIGYLVLALMILVAVVLPSRSEANAPGQDALALAVAVGATLNGLLLLVLPGQFNASEYDTARPHLPLLGSAFLGAGLVLLVAQHRRNPRWLSVIGCVAIGLTLLWCLMTVALPSRVWADIAYFGIFGVMTVALPWLAPRLQAIDPASLRTRLVFVLTTATALPLIVTVALVTDHQEQIAIGQAQALQETLASVLASDVSDYVRLHRAAVAGIATQPDILTLDADEQRRQLIALRRAYPQVSYFAVFAEDGRGLARSDGVQPTSLTGMAAFEAFRRANQPGTHVVAGRAGNGPMIGLMEPIREGLGPFAGLVMGVVEPSPLSQLLTDTYRRAEATIALIDDQGRIILESGPAPRPSFTDLSDEPPVAALMTAPVTIGGFRYGSGPDERMASYAPVVGSLWSIVIVQPVRGVLASVHAGRELTFALLVVMVCGSALVGWIVASWVSRPLATLVGAVDQLTVGNASAPLPRTRLTEVRQLAHGFGALRDRLVDRTEEREQAEARLRFIAEASRKLAGSLDYAETVTSVARLIVPTLADCALVDAVTETNEVERIYAAAADPRLDALMRQLRAFPPSLAANGNHSVGRVLQTGEPDILADIPDSAIDEIGTDPNHRALLRAVRPTSHIIVPLAARGRTIGALTVFMVGYARRLRMADLPLIEEVARRAALAIDHAALYREAQAAIRAREEFLSIASHELRTPLTTVKGYAQFLQRRVLRGAGYSDVVDDGQRGVLMQLTDQLMSQVGRLEALVDDLLDVSRLQSGRLDLRPEAVDLVALAGDVIARFEQAPEHTDRHHVHLMGPTTVIGAWDRSRLDQVLTNLVSNALKYSPNGGEVAVRILAQPESVTVEVTDQGLGISPEDRARLFQPFARGEDARRRISGTGLGLFIAAQIVERHGGSLTVDSTLGQGSTFALQLPYHVAASAATGIPGQPAAPQSPDEPHGGHADRAEPEAADGMEGHV